MKLFTLLILLIAVTSLVKCGDAETYEMAIFGDNGQVEYFKSNAYPKPMLASSAAGFNEKLLKEELIFDADEAGKINFDKGCTYKKDTKEQQLYGTKEGMENFHKIMSNEKVKALLQNSDSGVILGDILYVENKFAMTSLFPFSMFDDLAVKRVQIAKLEKEGKKDDEELKKLKSEFETVKNKLGHYKDPRKAETEEEKKKIAEMPAEKYREELNKKWEGRIKCGFKLFFKILKEQTSAWSKPWINSESKLSNRFYLLGGNHSFDADINAEESMILKIQKFKPDEIAKKDEKGFQLKHCVQHIVLNTDNFSIKNTNEDNLNSNHLTKVVRLFSNFNPSNDACKDKFKEENKPQVKIQVLDFNSHIFSCLHQVQKYVDQLNDEKSESEIFDLCIEGIKSLPKGKHPSLKEARQYLLRVKKALETFDQSEGVWRVMRAHHPPVNIEDNDEEIYFNEISFPSDYSKPEEKEKITLMELIKKARVEIFMASHHHSAQALIYKHGQQHKCTDTFKDPEGKKVECRMVNPQTLTGTHHTYLTEHTESEKCGDSVTLTDSSAAKLKKKEDTKLQSITYKLTSKKTGKPDHLFVFITGNSGRFFDPIAINTKSRGMLLWGRAMGTNYGFSKAKFTKDNFEITYYELQNDGLKVTGVFNVKKVDSVDEKDYALETKYLETYCKNEVKEKKTTKTDGIDLVGAIVKANSGNIKKLKKKLK